ncbi:MAG: hypothetical protein ACKO5R_10530 [Planctomycetaceae bacterium]
MEKTSVWLETGTSSAASTEASQPVPSFQASASLPASRRSWRRETVLSGAVAE